MKFSELLQKIFILAYKYVLPMLYSFFCIYQWRNQDMIVNRINFCLSLLLVLWVEKCFAFYRFYWKKARFEYEITILFVLVKTVNQIEHETPTYFKTYFNRISYYAFNTFLWLNLLCYCFCALLLIIYGILSIIFILRGENDIHRGLTEEEVNQIPHKIAEELSFF